MQFKRRDPAFKTDNFCSRTRLGSLKAIERVDHVGIRVTKSEVDDRVLQVKLQQLFSRVRHVVHVMAAVTLLGAATQRDVHVALHFLHVHCACHLTARIGRIFLSRALV